MRAMVIDRFGGPEVFRLADVATPAPDAGEVLVRVAYAGVNPADWKCREGWLGQFIKVTFPFIVGFDAAGVIAAVGAGVTDYKVGDRVVTNSNQGIGQWGSYAEFVKASTERVAKLPDNVDFAAAATLPTAAITSYEGLFEVCQLKAGQTVLVHGGAGSCGSFAIQFAKHAGARVVATCGPANLAYVRGMGAERAINYRDENIQQSVRDWAPGGVDVVLDTIGQGTLPEGAALLKRGGILGHIATLYADEPPHNAAMAEQRGGRIALVMSNRGRQGEQLRRIVALVASGAVKVPATEILPLDQAGAAQQRVKAGHVRGKLLLKVADI